MCRLWLLSFIDALHMSREGQCRLFVVQMPLYYNANSNKILRMGLGVVRCIRALPAHVWKAIFSF